MDRHTVLLTRARARGLTPAHYARLLGLDKIGLRTLERTAVRYYRQGSVQVGFRMSADMDARPVPRTRGAPVGD
jgi:hypothetical protein